MRAILESVVSYYVENPDKLTLQIVLLLCVIFLFKYVQRLHQATITAKEGEIIRLADDNRAYRNEYLISVKGLSVSKVRGISAPVKLNSNKKGKK